MAGLDNNMLSVIECLAKNKIQDAKNAAIVCCKNDTTKKNAANLNYYQKLLENGNSTFMELPPNLQAYMSLEDVSGFREDRYYVGEKQQKLYDQILVGTKVSDRLMEYGISYHNSTLLYGVPGTGKTEFARYVAYKLGLPYAYLNFSNLIDSYMGKTAQNLSRIFDYCKGMKCVLMLDEIDCIGQARQHNSGPDAEMGRIVISLMQCLDNLVHGQLEINAATLAEMTFMDECLIRNIINNKIPYEKIDKFDMALICNLLHCDEQYFAHPNIHNDFLDRVFDKEKDSNTSMKVKIKIRDFLSDFMFVNEVLSDEQKKNFICEK